jgi:hypothetical protein
VQHEPVRTTHTHLHPSFGTVDGEDGLHIHEHGHTGDSLHAHDHEYSGDELRPGKESGPGMAGSAYGQQYGAASVPYVSESTHRHMPTTVTHSHDHGAFGQPDHDDGIHSHTHSHSNDSSHAHHEGGG